MSLFAHYAGPALATAVSPEFALVQARHVAMPALLWGAAMVVVLLITAAQAVPSRLASGATAADPCEIAVCTVYGA